jgi:hypothetical protein
MDTFEVFEIPFAEADTLGEEDLLLALPLVELSLDPPAAGFDTRCSANATVPSMSNSSPLAS